MTQIDSDVRASIFFFSSRRRHTICSRDWSSDVCSSDLASRLVLSATGGGAAADTVLFGGRLAVGSGAGFSSAGRSTASGALRVSSVGAGAATRWTLYVGGARRRARAAPTPRKTPPRACTALGPASPPPPAPAAPPRPP